MWLILTTRGTTVWLRLARTYIVSFATAECFLTSALDGNGWEIILFHSMSYSVVGGLTFGLDIDAPGLESTSRRCC